MTYVRLKWPAVFFKRIMSAPAIKNFIGVDVSKASLDVSVIKSESLGQIFHFKLPNSHSDFIRMENTLMAQGIRLNAYTLIVLEHTGVYTRPLLNFLNNKNSKVCLEASARIKKTIGIQRGKNDKIDSKRIAEYGLRNYKNIKYWEPVRPVIQHLKTLLTNQERIAASINRFKVGTDELKGFCTAKEIQSLQRINKPAISGLNQSLKKIKLKIKEIALRDKKLKSTLKLLKSIPQIGNITALNLICCTNEFRLHTNAKTLACYLGIAPFEHTSGTSVKGKTRVSHVANKKMKALIHLAAMRCITKTGIFRNYYDRKVAEGKHSMSVLNAIRNKIIHRIAAVIKRGTPYVKDLSN